MKTILVNPPLWSPEKYGKRLVEPYGPPLGIAYVGTYLRAAGKDVETWDCSYLGLDATVSRLREARPDVIGMTCLTEQRGAVMEMCRRLRGAVPQAKIVLGGVHPTLMPEQVGRHFGAHVIVRHEGEETMRDLLDALEEGRSLEGVAGIAYPEGEGVRINPPRPPISNLDTIPAPDLSGFGLDGYGAYGVFEHLKRDPRLSGRVWRFVPILTSRGCVAHCQFCSTTWVWQNRWRARSAPHVVDEIERLCRERGRNFFNIVDDTFTVNRKRVLAICDEILRRRLDVLWDCETRVSLVDAELLRRMREAGCYAIAYGVESASEKVLAQIKKEAGRAQIVDAFERTRRAGIRTNMLLMVGNPGETEETIRETVSLVAAVRPDFCVASMTMVFPGTGLFEWAKAAGFIDESYWLEPRPAPYNTVEHGLRTLERWESDILMAASGGWERRLRQWRSWLDRHLGVRVTRRWIEFWRGERLVLRLPLAPGGGRAAGA